MPPALRSSLPRLFEHLALILCCALSLIIAPSESGPFILQTLRLFAALSLFTFIPGYLLALLLFGAVPRLSHFWLIGLSVSLSFTLLVFDGILFNALRLPITGLSLHLSQLAWTALLLAALMICPDRVRPGNLLIHRLLAAWRCASAGSRSLYALCACLVLLFAISLSYALFAAPVNEVFTELSIQDPGSLNAGPFLNVPLEQDSYDLSVTVVNREKAAQPYTLVVSTPTRSTGIPVFLNRGETWSERITVPLDVSAPSELLQVNLYLPGTPQPYRQTHLWIYKDSPH